MTKDLIGYLHEIHSPLEEKLDEKSPIFETDVPVIIGNDREHPIGKAKCFRDPETKNLTVEIEFNSDVSDDIANVLGLMTTTGLSFSGTKHIQGVAYGLT